MKRALLLDGDTFVFAAASANEYEAQWDTWLWTLHADLGAAIRHFDTAVEKIIEDLQGDKVIVALTDSSNWRKSVMPGYKANRASKRKPVVYGAMREYVTEKYTTLQRPGLEGDDILGILSTHPYLVEADEKIVISVCPEIQSG